jgi:sigma-E factor negative regulatory protein RseA
MKQPNEISNMNQSAQQPNHAISAWMDGDTETDMPERLDSEHGRSTWALYHLIGDTLRTPELAMPATLSLQQRISLALEHEPAIIAAAKTDVTPHRQSDATAKRNTRFWGKSVWPGVAMAAAVASVIWVAKPFLLPEFSSPTEQVVEVTAPQPIRATEVALNAPVVRDYVSTHREMSGPANVRQVSFGAMR